MEKTKRNIMMQKAGGNAGKNSVGYRISLPAQMVRDLGVTPEDRAVILYMEDGKLIIEKDKSENKKIGRRNLISLAHFYKL